MIDGNPMAPKPPREADFMVHDEEDLWRAVRARDQRADGQFVYAVRSTGVFCRPHCASRLPRRENVLFFAGPSAAKRAGFRACLRCVPDGDRRGPTWIAKACALIDADVTINNRALAEQLQLSPEHLLRRFKRELGITPQAYRRRVLAERAKRALPQSDKVLEAAFGAGYKSSSRFYAGISPELGTSVSSARRGDVEVWYVLRECSLGQVLVGFTGRGVCDVSLGDRAEPLVGALRERFPRAVPFTKRPPSFVKAVVEMADRPCTKEIPCDIQNTAFQERVWSALRAIPLGETRSYKELAKAIGAERSARAVARACAQNPLAVVIPCHRVVREDGNISGYRWGKQRKRALLEREATRKARRGA